MNANRVICSVCRKTYRAKIPKGGDGSMFVPRLHHLTIHRAHTLGLTVYNAGKNIVCPGSYEEGLDIK